ncbi:ankyrin repeat domain-containing protein 17-like [Symsagittifera roscoffensis]|uniref:ankyrin repeat domain-containing protein 17-like n=1 Tax=Symsagittifera roscoffensis TaxID=84072 RepID=UPI00307B69D6
MDESEVTYYLDESHDVYAFDEDKLHRMAMRYRKISSQMIQIYLDSCHFGEQHIIQSMLQENALTDHVVNYRDANGRTGLSYACEYGYDDIVKTLARCGERVVDPNIADKDGNTPLMFASQAGHEMCVSVLLNYFPNLDIDHINNFGLNSLMKAAIQGHSECARFLILSGASPFVPDSQKNLTPDAWATYCGRLGTADLIKRLKVTLGPKLCSLCGYTKPLASCPGHAIGLCKTHSPYTSRLDINLQSTPLPSKKITTGEAPRHLTTKISACKVFVHCPSGSVVKIHSPHDSSENSLAHAGENHTEQEDACESNFEQHMNLLQTGDAVMSTASSCPALPNFANSCNLPGSKENISAGDPTSLLLSSKNKVSKKSPKKAGFHRIISWFTCFSSKEVASKDFSPKFESKSVEIKHRKKGSSSRRRNSYSRQAQVSRRISFSS